jgi:short-subunit dehydrogenase
MDVKNKVVIITGASAGIGAATARRFAQAGAKVVLVARRTDKLQALAEELLRQGYDASSFPADMRDFKAVQEMVEQTYRQYGGIDILINNAGQSVAGTIANVHLEDFQSIMELNVYGVLVAMQAVIPKMRTGGGGLIINVSSMVSKMRLPGLGTYAATKAALNLLSDTARVELAGEGIRVITMFPRMTATDFGKNALGDQRLRQAQRGQGAREGVVVDQPEDVARRILSAAQTEPEEQYMDR